MAAVARTNERVDLLAQLGPGVAACGLAFTGWMLWNDPSWVNRGWALVSSVVRQLFFGTICVKTILYRTGTIGITTCMGTIAVTAIGGLIFESIFWAAEFGYIFFQ
jgi:hypothetical protein